jgi:uncharacterized delta-60 repeat protein/uncharacterized repeat protein (TIGR01451 family)
MRTSEMKALVRHGRAQFWSAACAVVLLLLSIAGLHAQTTNVAPNVLEFTSATYSVEENTPGYAIVTVRRSGDLFSDLNTIDYTSTDGTAVGGVDYYPVSGTLEFLPGQNYQSFFIWIFDDFIQNGNRTINLSLKNPTGTNVVLGAQSTAVLTIIDDESASNYSSAGVVEVAPGNAMNIASKNGDYEITRDEWWWGDNDDGPRGAQVTFVRRGGTKGKVLVDWYTTTNIVPSYVSSIYSFYWDFYFGYAGGIAQPGIDFIPTNGTVAMEDFQASTNILIKIPPISYAHVYATNTFGAASNLDYTFTVPPSSFGVGLTNLRAAPEEDPNLIQPTLGVTVRNVNVINNSYGFAFVRMHHTVDEGTGIANVWVYRSGPLGIPVTVRAWVNNRNPMYGDSPEGSHRWNYFPLEAESDYASPFVDYLPPGSAAWWRAITPSDQTPGSGDCALSWGETETGLKSIRIPIIQDNLVEFAEDLKIELYQRISDQGFINMWCSYSTMTIKFDDQAAGAADRDFNRENDPLTSPPHNLIPGANKPVQAVAVQPDGKIVIGGDFTAFNTTQRNSIARVNQDGQLDPTFNPGLGADNYVSAVALQPDGRILIGGGFTSVNASLRYGIARLMPNGSVDPSFNPGFGADGPVRAVSLQADGKILIGGEFIYYNGTNRNYLARLNADGSLDTTFDPGEGPNGPIYSIALTAGAMNINRQASGGQAEDRFPVDSGSMQGSITVNYDFLQEPDTLRIYNGSDLIFDAGLINGVGTITVPYSGSSSYLTIVVNEGNNSSATTLWRYSLNINPAVDERPVIGGNFTSFNGTEMNYVARLNPDGSLDQSFATGTGADDVVYAVAKQGNKVVIGGAFTSIDVRNRRGVARLNEDGTLDTSYDTGSGTDNTVYSIAVQPNGQAVLGGVFVSFNGTRRIGLLRLNLDGTLDTSFMDTAYNQFAGVINPLSRENPLTQPNFISALAPYRQTNSSIFVVTNITTAGDTNFSYVTNYTYADYLYVGGLFKRMGGGYDRNNQLSRYNFARVIGGVTPGPGNIQFATPNYTIDENGSRLFITMVRTNGSLGAIAAKVSTLDPPAGPGVAVSGRDYYSTNRNVAWTSTYGQNCGDARQVSSARMGANNHTVDTNQALCDFDPHADGFAPVSYSNPDNDDFFVTVIDNGIIDGDRVLNLKVTDPTSTLTLGGVPIPLGFALGKVDSTLTIVDNDMIPGTLGFSSKYYSIIENGKRAAITVTRVGGSGGDVSIAYTTGDGTAKARKDYTATQGRLYFASGQITNTIYVPIIDNAIAELDKTINLTLSDPSGFPVSWPVSSRLDPNRTTAVLTIIDDDFAPGRLSFLQPDFTVGINDGSVTVTVKRSGGALGDLRVSFATSDGTAVNGVNYLGTNGTLFWVDGDITPKTFTIPILNDYEVATNRTINIALSNSYVNNQFNTNALGLVNATLTIQNNNSYGVLGFSRAAYVVDEKSAQAIITVLRAGGLSGILNVNYTTADVNATAGVNYQTSRGKLTFAEGEASKTFIVPILDDGVLTGDKVLSLSLSNAVVVALGTNSPSVMGRQSNAVVTIVDRELSNTPAGSLDRSFVSAEGADGFIYGLALQADNNLLLGGDFTKINNVNKNRMARLTTAGALDYSFDVGTGPNGSVRSILVQDDNRILVGGLFTVFNNTNRNYITRLNVDGGNDPTFNPGAGADNPIYAMALQADARILVGGDFATFNGVSRRHIARLNTNGVVDVTFDPGIGTDGGIYALALQPDGKILVAGDFTTYNNQAIQRIARLNINGALDPSFNPGLGANAAIRALFVQSDGKILIGGLFTNVNGIALSAVARLNNDGSVDSAFHPGAGADNAVYTIALQDDGKIVLGGDFLHFGGINRSRLARLNPDGTPDPTINIGTGANAFVSSLLVQPDRKIVFVGGFTSFNGEAKKYIARIEGGAMADSGSLEFSSSIYRAMENETNAVVTVRRTGGTLGQVSVDYQTALGGSAKANADYVPSKGTLTFQEGETFQTFLVPLIDNNQVTGDLTVNLVLSNFVGAQVGNQPTATIVIQNNDSEIGFSLPGYSVNKNVSGRSAVITVLRQGATNGIAQVSFLTASITAVTNVNYLPVAGVLTFNPGETLKTFAVPILTNNLVEGNKMVRLILSNPTGNAVLGQASSVLTIVDDNYAPGVLSFSAGNYYVDENGGAAVITVTRTNGSSGIVQVSFATRDGSALSGVDYVGTNGIVAFADGEVTKSFMIPVINDLIMEDDKTLDVLLSNPVGGAQLGSLTNSILTVVNNNYIYGNIVLSSASFTVVEANTNLVVTVSRKNGTAGIVKVDYLTTDGTAINGINYITTKGSLTFADGETTKTVVIPILRDNQVSLANKTFTFAVQNPIGGATLGYPRTSQISIVDSDLMVGFVTDKVTVREDAGKATLNVGRSLGGPATLTVDYATAGGTGHDGTNYAAVSGRLIFSIGEYSKTITVPIINNDVIEGNKTVNVVLSNPSDRAVLGTNIATITILDDDGSLIIPAGFALVGEQAPANGVIDPNETVTIEFGLRNVGRRDTTNLWVTLLATNGVTAPGTNQNYGVLVAGGPLLALPLTFTAVGQTGATIVATFDLRDGDMPLGQTTFSFSLGSAASSFVNTGSVTILDHAAAAPYPAKINVTGMPGRVSKVVATIDGFGHGYPGDVDILLVSPTGESAILMAGAGDGITVTNLVLTFDDTAATQMPSTNRLTTGTYRPSNFKQGVRFIAPAPTAPYGSELSVFKGINPNGTWSLYVLDDTALDSGAITRGWRLNLTTVKDLNTTADLAVGMEGVSTQALVGANIHYTLYATNLGPLTATGVTITNDLPEGISFVSANPSKGSVALVNRQLVLSFLVLTNGEFAKADITVAVTNAGTLNLKARIGGTETDLRPGNDQVSVTIAATSPEPPKVGSASMASDGQFQLTLSGVAGQGFVIEKSIDLKTWTPVLTNMFQSNLYQYIDSSATNTPYQFYRARSNP